MYCNNNPVRYVDPSGEIAITTLILIGSAVIALVAAGATAYDSYKTTGKVDWVNTIRIGLTWFAMAYTLGTTAYGLYLSYCAYKGITPVAEVKFNSNAEIGSNAASAGKGTQTNIKADNPGKQVEAVGEVGSGTKPDYYVTPDGVAFKNGIPDNYVENPYRNGSYGVFDENGKFSEKLRIDPATPTGKKGPSCSHYHIDGGKEHYSPRPGDDNPLGF